MVSVINERNWDMLGLPSGSKASRDAISKGLKNINDNRVQNEELRFYRQSNQRANESSVQMRGLLRSSDRGFKTLTDTLHTTSKATNEELYRIHKDISELTKILKYKNFGGSSGGAGGMFGGFGLPGGAKGGARGGRLARAGQLLKRGALGAALGLGASYLYNQFNGEDGEGGGGTDALGALIGGLAGATMMRGGGAGVAGASKGFGGALKTGGKMALRGLGRITGLGAAGLIGYDAYDATVNANERLGVKGKVTNQQKLLSGVGGALNSITLGAGDWAAEKLGFKNLSQAFASVANSAEDEARITAETLDKITEKTKNAALEKLNDLDRELEAKRQQSSSMNPNSSVNGASGGTYDAMGNFTPTGGGAPAPNVNRGGGRGAGAGAVAGAAIADSINTRGGFSAAGSDHFRGGMYNSDGTIASSVGDVSGFARAGSRVSSGTGSGTTYSLSNPAYKGGDDLTGASRADLMKATYDAFRKQGYSHEGAKAMVGEVNRENSFDASKMFGNHIDPDNKKNNAGMISWQKDRADAFRKHMTERGFMNPDGTMKQTRAALDAQVEFLDKEMREGKNGGGKGLSDYLKSDNVNANEAMDRVGRNYIKWRIDDPAYRGSGMRNRGYGYEAISKMTDGKDVGAQPNSQAGSIDGKIPVKGTGIIDPSDLNNQKGQAFGGGDTAKGTTELAKGLYATNKEGISHFSSFNDKFHARKGGKHPQGLAIDYTLKETTSEAYASEKKRVRDFMKSAGLREGKDFHVIDEKNNPSSRSSGAHMHVQFQNQEAATRYQEASQNPEFQKKHGLTPAVVKDAETGMPVQSQADTYKSAGFDQKNMFGPKRDVASSWGKDAASNIVPQNWGLNGPVSSGYQTGARSIMNSPNALNPTGEGGPKVGFSKDGRFGLSITGDPEFAANSARAEAQAQERFANFDKKQEEKWGSSVIYDQMKMNQFNTGQFDNMPDVNSQIGAKAKEVPTPPTYETPDSAGSYDAMGNYSPSAAPAAPPPPPPQPEIKSQPDDIGLRGMTSTDVF